MSIEEERKVLEDYLSKSKKRIPNKEDALNIILLINSLEFRIQKNDLHVTRKFFGYHSSPNIDLSDAKEDLDYYYKSKNKQKDNNYFHSGIRSCQQGINSMISSLKRLEGDSNPDNFTKLVIDQAKKRDFQSKIEEMFSIKEENRTLNQIEYKPIGSEIIIVELRTESFNQLTEEERLELLSMQA